MVHSPQKLLLFALCLLSFQCALSQAKMMTKEEMRAKQSAAAQRFAIAPPKNSTGQHVKNITFTNPRASGMSAIAFRIATLPYNYPEFYVDGTTIPLVDFDIGPSWSGLLPISSAANETRQVLVTFSVDCPFALRVSLAILLVFPAWPSRK